MGVWSLIFSEIVVLNLTRNASFLSSDLLLMRARRESNNLSRRSRLAEAPNRRFSWTRLKRRTNDGRRFNVLFPKKFREKELWVARIPNLISRAFPLEIGSDPENDVLRCPWSLLIESFFRPEFFYEKKYENWLKCTFSAICLEKIYYLLFTSNMTDIIS